MNIHQTVTAIQLSGDVRIWSVEFSSEREHHYKSEAPLVEGDSVVVKGKNGVFVVGRVIGEVVNIDFDSELKFGWILNVIPDPELSFDHYEGVDAAAAKKIAHSRVKQEAQRYLADTGLEVSDFAISSLPLAGQEDA